MRDVEVLICLVEAMLRGMGCCSDALECFVFLGVTRTVLTYCVLLSCRGKREAPKSQLYRVVWVIRYLPDHNTAVWQSTSAHP